MSQTAVSLSAGAWEEEAGVTFPSDSNGPVYRKACVVGGWRLRMVVPLKTWKREFLPEVTEGRRPLVPKARVSVH